MRKRSYKTKIIVHWSTFVYFVICLMVGWFKESMIAFFIILCHEYAHTIFAQLFKYNVRDIHLYPFGAFVDIEDYGLHVNWQDFIVAISGPLSFFPLYVIAIVFRTFLGDHCFLYYQKINLAVCLFNLLPIWPLDGSKILLVIFSYFVDYLQTLKMIIPISFMSLVILMWKYQEPGCFMLYGYLWTQMIIYGRDFYFFYLRLLFFRRKSQRSKKIKFHNDTSFLKPYQNYYLYQGRIIDEKEFINSKIFIDNDKS